MTVTTSSFGGQTLDVKQFGATGNGTTDDTAAVNAGVAWLNTAARRTLIFPFGNYLITGALSTITQADATITGQGARLTMGSGAGSNGAMFVIGSASDNAARFRLSGFQINYANTPTADDFTFDLVQTADSSISDMVLLNAPSFLRYGGVTTNASRVAIKNVTGNCNNGAASDANILLRRGSAGRFIDVHLNGPGGGNSGTKAIVKLAPVSGGTLDTFWFRGCSFQFFTTSAPPSSADGKAYGFYADRTLGDITNIWVDGCVFDHTTICAFRFGDGGGAVATPFDRCIHVKNNRFSTDAGRGIYFDFSNPSSGLFVRGVQISGNFVSLSDNSIGIDFVGRTVARDTIIANNNVEDSISGTAKDYAISFDTSYIRVIGNHIGATQTSTGFTTAIRVAHADNDNFVIRNNIMGEVATAISEPTYTGTSDKRIVDYGRSFAKAALPSAKNIGNLIYVPDETGGAVTCFADGTNWRRVTDRAVVS